MHVERYYIVVVGPTYRGALRLQSRVIAGFRISSLCLQLVDIFIVASFQKHLAPHCSTLSPENDRAGQTFRTAAASAVCGWRWKLPPPQHD